MPEPKSPTSAFPNVAIVRLDAGIPHPDEIEAPWVLFLEPDEYLDQRQLKALERFVEEHEPGFVECSVERHLDRALLASFAWVPTRHLFQESPKEIRRYRTREMRLVHVSFLSRVEIPRKSDGAAGVLTLKAGSPCPAIPSGLTISRRTDAGTVPVPERPDDFDLFRKGHQAYYDDAVYCERFVWPHSVYHTVRFHYIPSILEGLKLGLGNPEIVHFVLAYLIRFRDFDTAGRIVKLVPEYWGDRHPMLHISAGTVEFARGNADRALPHFRKAVDLRPDSELIVANTIKVCLLLGRYDDAQAVESIYEKTAGKRFEDDFVAHFRRIHGNAPSRLATVSLCMVVRNEEKNLARALRFAREIADEMIVVDTGSTDRSAEIAGQAGARVYPFPWDNDFSAARNFAIEKASCDYILMLDGDEYVSPLFFTEGLILKKLLSPEKPCAFRFSIGYYYNESDWLFLLGEAGNFREESKAVRLFPRLPGIRYRGRISETVEPSLREQGIPVERIPEWSLHILHDQEDRRNRVLRKVPLYRESDEPDYTTALDAVKDFSFLGDRDETVRWLKCFYGMKNGEPDAHRRMGLRLAGLLEAMDPLQAEGVYREIVEHSGHDAALLRAYASFLIRNNRTEMLGGLPLETVDPGQEAHGAVRVEHNGYAALRHFEAGDMEKAFLTLEAVLDEAAANVFAQAIRFYFLVSLGRIDGAVLAMDHLFEMTAGPRGDRVETIGDVLRLLTELSDTLLKTGYLKERALVLRGALALEKALVNA